MAAFSKAMPSLAPPILSVSDGWSFHRCNQNSPNRIGQKKSVEIREICVTFHPTALYSFFAQRCQFLLKKTNDNAMKRIIDSMTITIIMLIRPLF